MSGFRGSDESLDREIKALERIVRLRLRRATADFQELDRELRELRRERSRRRAESTEVVRASATAEESSP